MDIVAYTDGSYREVEGFGPVYSGAAIICCDDKDPVVLTTVGTDPVYLKRRNISGEILAVIMMCEYCMNTLKVTQDDTLLIVHDYSGIANWCKTPGDKDFWKAKNSMTMSYRDFMNKKIKTRCKVLFKDVKSHATTQGNIIADKCAFDAITNYVNKMKENG